ncbi:MAG: histidine phosphatase family protein [Solirubrobacterales bacterium]|nr:histidine phosphatase family protein [Solirubrobacterales bacterium]
MLITLIRHGETEWSKSGQHTGTTDLPLLPEGEQAAVRTGERLRDVRFDLVRSSPLQRARRTAEIAGLESVELDDDMREWRYGDYEGRTTQDIREERPGWDIWSDGCPGGETIEALAARVDRVIARVLDAGAERVALVAHGHLLRVLGARWGELEPSAGGRLGLSTAAICELGFERERRVIRLWNDTRHLDHQ